MLSSVLASLSLLLAGALPPLVVRPNVTVDCPRPAEVASALGIPLVPLPKGREAPSSEWSLWFLRQGTDVRMELREPTEQVALARVFASANADCGRLAEASAIVVETYFRERADAERIERERHPDGVGDLSAFSLGAQPSASSSKDESSQGPFTDASASSSTVPRVGLGIGGTLWTRTESLIPAATVMVRVRLSGGVFGGLEVGFPKVSLKPSGTSDAAGWRASGLPMRLRVGWQGDFGGWQGDLAVHAVAIAETWRSPPGSVAATETHMRFGGGASLALRWNWLPRWAPFVGVAVDAVGVGVVPTGVVAKTSSVQGALVAGMEFRLVP